MSDLSFFRRWWQDYRKQGARRSHRRQSQNTRLSLEQLEDRTLLSDYAFDNSFQVVGLTNMRADPLYSSITGKGIGIADIDTGIDPTNPDLKTLVAYYDAVTNSHPLADPATPISQAKDPIGHGSHTAGIAAS